MGMTLVEKILSNHVGRIVKPGEFVLANIDATMSHDANRPLVVDAFKEMGGNKVFNPKHVIMALEHNYPALTESHLVTHQKIREFCKEQKCVFYEGEGIGHSIMMEKGHVLPGDLVVATDSHTTTYGAIGAFATGIGSTDMAVALMTGKLWFLVPETIRINLVGTLQPGVCSKDIILYIINKMTADGATYKAVQFGGSVIKDLSMDARMTIANMSVEMGAKVALIEPDDVTFAWLKNRFNREFSPEYPDPDAEYSEVIDIDVSNITPYVAKPHQVDNGVPIKEVEGTPIHQGNIVSCTGARIEDLRMAATILKGRKISINQRLIIVPSSREVFKTALEEGLISIFVDSGGIIGSPSCAGCSGQKFATPSDGDVVISTANRNFVGRLGNSKAFIYLASPATVAASVLSGKITDPRHF
jgi:3-isopropylmalate/(R)-2-methylmalate dehydratase large subunit